MAGRIVGAGLVLLAIGLLALGIFRILQDRVLTATARVEVTSTWVEEGLASRGRQDICHHDVRYLERPAETALVTSAVSCRGSTGDILTVFYDPDDPSTAALDGNAYKWGDLAGIIVLAAVVALPGWVLIKPAKAVGHRPAGAAGD